MSFFFFFNDTATTEIYTLSLHDALPSSSSSRSESSRPSARPITRPPHGSSTPRRVRSEEHTSELQLPCKLVCRLLLEKKKIAAVLLRLPIVALAPLKLSVPFF